MKKPLIIFFNDEKMVTSATDQSTFLKKMKVLTKDNALPVSSIDDFSTLINYLPDDLEVYVLIHIMGDALGSNLQQNWVEYQGKTWAISLKQEFPKCNFQFVTSNLSQTSTGVYQGVPARNITDLMDEIFVKKSNLILPQKVGEILSKEIILKEQTSTTFNRNEPNVSIITALTSDEYSSFRENIYSESEEKGILTGKFKPIEKYNYDYGSSFQIVRQKNMGMVDAAITSSNILNKPNNNILIMSGVCGGRESETDIYDIIIPNKIVDIITGKYEKSEFIPYGFNESINEDLIEYISETSRTDEIRDRMYSLIPNNSENSRKNEIVTKLKFKFDTLACGSFVLKTNDFLERKAQEINNKIIAFEMESYGVMRATKLLNNTDKLSLIVKSVMDYTNENKKDDISGEPIKNLAAYMSYLCVRVLIPYVTDFYRKEICK